MGYNDSRYFTNKYMKPLLNEGRLLMTLPDKLNSKNQRYVAKKIAKSINTKNNQ